MLSNPRQVDDDTRREGPALASGSTRPWGRIPRDRDSPGCVRRLGTTEAEILLNFPTLRADDLVNAWAYARSHREEVEDQIRANEEDQS